MEEPKNITIEEAVTNGDKIVSEYGKPMMAISQDLGHEHLLKVLYFFFDAFSRSGINFFVVRDTAKWMRNQDQLRGDHLDVGIRKLEWISGNQDLFNIYMQNEGLTPTKETDKLLEYVYQGVPVTIHLYPDNECITALTSIVYEHESWMVPNQYERFVKEFEQ